MTEAGPDDPSVITDMELGNGFGSIGDSDSEVDEDTIVSCAFRIACKMCSHVSGVL